MSIFTSIAVSPSGSTLLNALQVTTAAGVVLNEGVTLVDSANPANVGSILASGAMLIEPGGVNSQPVTGTITANQATAANFNATVVQGTATNLSVTAVQPTAANLNATVVGTVTANAGTGTLAENLTQVAGTALGATAVVNFGSTPAAAAVPAVNTALVNIGTTAVSTATTGVQKVGITGNTAIALDSTLAVGTAPSNGLGVLTQYNTSAPSPTNAQTQSLQSDSSGDVIIRPFRRGKTVATPTTITSSSSATSVMAAQGATFFADITNLIITVTPAATTDIAFTATLSDGTASFIYDMDTGALATATADPTMININFNPPLPATSANTAWTIALSVATVTVHITVVAIQTKAG